MAVPTGDVEQLAALAARGDRDALGELVVGLSYEEAADVMGVPIGTIRSRVFRARAALMESLAEGPRPRVVALPGGLL